MNIFKRLLSPIVAAILPRRMRKEAAETGFAFPPGSAKGKHRSRGTRIRQRRKRDAMQKRSRRINYGLEV